VVTTSYSQDYKSFEWELVGISSLHSKTNNGSAGGLHTEARLNLNNSLSFGLKYSWIFLDNSFVEEIRESGINSAFAITGDYHFYNKASHRAYAGLELGAFNNVHTTILGEPIGGTGLGLSPRIGYEFYFLRVTVSYNYTLKEDFPDYFALGLGLNIGGGYRKLE